MTSGACVLQMYFIVKLSINHLHYDRMTISVGVITFALILQFLLLKTRFNRHK